MAMKANQKKSTSFEMTKKLQRGFVNFWSPLTMILNSTIYGVCSLLVYLLFGYIVTIFVVVSLLVFVFRNKIVSKIADLNTAYWFGKTSYVLGAVGGFGFGIVITIPVILFVRQYVPTVSPEVLSLIEYLAKFIVSILMIAVLSFLWGLFFTVLSEKGLSYVNFAKNLKKPDKLSTLRIALEYLNSSLSEKGIVLPTRRLFVYLRWNQLRNNFTNQIALLRSLENDDEQLYSTIERQLKDSNSVEELGIRYKLNFTERMKIRTSRWLKLVAAIIGVIVQLLIAFLK